MIHHDILLLPSLHEGMSLTTLEALSCGMAVLVTRNSGTSIFTMALMDLSILETHNQ